jgi:hypothetical protein
MVLAFDVNAIILGFAGVLGTLGLIAITFDKLKVREAVYA